MTASSNETSIHWPSPVRRRAWRAARIATRPWFPVTGSACDGANQQIYDSEYRHVGHWLITEEPDA